jgi:hypothetical protein
MPGVPSIAAGESNGKTREALVEARTSQAFRDLPEEEIEALVQSLNSLHEGELGIDMLVACGERAVPLLRRFLIQGSPSGIFVPRQRAVRALAQLGAKDVLIEYLDLNREISDPVAAHGEEAVQNSTARALGAWRTDDVYEALERVLQRKHLIGAVETVGEFRRPEAVPQLVAALEDDFCRSAAEDALHKMGEAPHSALIEAARAPEPSGNRETPSSRSRRRSVLRLLESLRLFVQDWRKIAALLHDKDPEIAARACAIALAVADDRNKRFAVKRLLEVLPSCDWLLQGEIQGWLESHIDVARPVINEEIKKRQDGNPAHQATDNILRLLLAVTREAGAIANGDQSPQSK